MDGLPGVIASDDDFGVNSAGHAWSPRRRSPSSRAGTPQGKPEFVRARKALQYSRSIDDFVRIMLDGNNGGYANDWLVGDNKTGEIALFELGLKNHSVQRTKDGCFFGANFPDVRQADCARRPSSTRTRRTRRPTPARSRWEQLMAQHKGKIDVELGKRFETDDFDVIAAARRAPTNGRSAAGSRSRRAACPSGTGARSTRAAPSSPR